MPRYKSISEFRHSCVIQGRKYLVGPDEVIESPTPISYIFLQEVSADTPLTSKSVYQGSRLQQQVATIQEKNNDLVTTSVNVEVVEALKQKFDSFIEKYEKDMIDFTTQINEQLADIEKTELANKTSDTKFRDDTIRRLSILKDAVRTLEDELFGPAENQPTKNS